MGKCIVTRHVYTSIILTVWKRKGKVFSWGKILFLVVCFKNLSFTCWCSWYFENRFGITPLHLPCPESEGLMRGHGTSILVVQPRGSLSSSSVSSEYGCGKSNRRNLCPCSTERWNQKHLRTKRITISYKKWKTP